MRHTSDLEGLHAQMQGLVKELEHFKGKARFLEKLEKEKGDLEVRINDLKIQMSSLHHEIEQKDSELVQSKKKQDTMIFEIKELGKFIKEFKGQAEKTNEQLVAQLENGEAERETLEENFALIQSQAEELAKLKNRTDNLNEELKARVDEQDQEKKILIEDFSNKFNEIRQDLEQREAELVDARELIDQLKDAVVKDKKDEDLGLLGELENLKKLLSRTEKELKDKSEQVLEISEQNTHLQQTTLELQDSLFEAENALKKFKQKGDKTLIANQDRELGLLRAQVASLQEETNSYRQKSYQGESVDIYKEKTQNLARELEDSKNKTKTIQAERDQLQSQIRDLKYSMSKMEREMAFTSPSNLNISPIKPEFNFELQNLATDNQMLKNQILKLESENELVSDRVRIEQEEAARLRQASEKAEETIFKLTQELDKKAEEAENYKAQTRELKQTAEELVDDFKSQQSQIEELQKSKKQVEELKKRHKADDKELKKLFEHNKKLTEVYEKTKAELEIARKEAERAKQIAEEN